jgi:hypothetical protein
MTKDQIKALLLSNPLAVERAVLTIYSRQTANEQASATTQHRNGQGFNAFDAERGTYWASWIGKGRHLDGTHLAKARKMSLRYVGQLAEVSQAKLAARTLHVIEGSLADLDPFQNYHGPSWSLQETARTFRLTLALTA